MEKFEKLVNYLSKLADKYQFEEREMSDLQDMIEDIYNGDEDERPEDEDRGSEPESED
jgi:hypothetical protein